MQILDAIGNTSMVRLRKVVPPLGEEIWAQTGGAVDAFVHCVGTAASLRGVATVLRRHKRGVRIVAVEPAESSVLLGGQPGPHKIEGVGIGYTPPLWGP
jgi:cysteine synthase A